MQMVVVWGGCIFMSRGVNLLFSLFSSALRHLTKQKFTVLSSRLCRHTHAGSDVSVKNEKKMKRLNYVGAISLGTACALVLSKVRENTHIHTHTCTLMHIDILVHTCTKSQAEQFPCRDISLRRLLGTALVAKRYRNFHKNDTLFFTFVFPAAEGVLYEMINNFNLLKLNFKASSPKEQWVLCHVQNTHIGLIFNRLCPSLKRVPWILPQSSD